MEARYEVTLIDPAECGRTRQEIVPAKAILPDSPDNRERVLRVAETYAIIDVLNESLARESARAFVRGR